MNNDLEIEKMIVTVALAVIIIVAYRLGRVLASKTKFTGRLRTYMAIIFASSMLLIIFYCFAILRNFWRIGSKYTTAMAAFFIPVSMVLLLAFTCLFVLTKARKR